MTEIKSWALMLCISLIISSVSLFIAPEGSLKKFLGYIISVFILTVVLLPLTKMDFSRLTDFDSAEFNINDEEYSHMLSEYIYDNGEKVLQDAIKNELDKICTDKYSIETVFDKTNDNQIGIESIIITIRNSDLKNIPSIRKKVGELTGVIPEVNVNEFQSSD